MSEQRLDFIGDSSKAQAEFDKMTRANAKLREEVRKLNTEVIEGSQKSTASWNDGVKALERQQRAAREAAAAWAEGMATLKRQQEEFAKATSPFSSFFGGKPKGPSQFSAFGNISPSAGGGTSASWANGLDKLAQQNNKWTEGMRQLSTQRMTMASMSGELSASLGIDKAAASIAGLASGYIAIGAAVGAVVKLHHDWSAETDKVAQSYQHVRQNIVAALAASGKLQSGPAFSQWVSGLKGASRTAATQAFAGVSMSGSTIPGSKQFGIAEQIARLEPTGLNLAEVGGQAGDIGELMPSLGAGDVLDTAMFARRELGSKVGMLGSAKWKRAIGALQRSGMSEQQAMSAAVVALQNDQSPETLERLAGGGRSRADRLATMEAKKLIPSDAIAAVGGRLGQAISGDFGMAGVQSLGTFSEGRAALSETAAAMQREQGVVKNGPMADAIARGQKSAVEGARQRGGEIGATLERFSQSMDRLFQFFGLQSEASVAQKVGPNNRNVDPAIQEEIKTLLKDQYRIQQEQLEVMKNASTNRRTSVNTHTESN